MRRTVVSVLLILAVGSSVFAYRSVACHSWQDEYKRFMYTEMLKNSPVIYGPAEIDAIVGDRPPRCGRPTELTNEDVARFRDENIGPNHFLGRNTTPA